VVGVSGSIHNLGQRRSAHHCRTSRRQRFTCVARRPRFRRIDPEARPSAGPSLRPWPWASNRNHTQEEVTGTRGGETSPGDEPFIAPVCRCGRPAAARQRSPHWPRPVGRAPSDSHNETTNYAPAQEAAARDSWRARTLPYLAELHFRPPSARMTRRERRPANMSPGLDCDQRPGPEVDPVTVAEGQPDPGGYLPAVDQSAVLRPGI
jgi:hypothetical protein